MATLRQFRYYVRIVELGSMTKAAERLGVAQPALGLQMRQLEQEYGVALLQRHSRGVIPTSEGQLLYERATEILELVARTAREVGASRQDVMETLRLGMSPSLTQLVASDLLIRARRDVPQISLHLVEEMSFVLLEVLRHGDIEMALAYDLPTQPGIESEALLREELLFVMAPGEGVAVGAMDAHGISGTIDLGDVLAVDLTLPGPRDAIRQIVENAAATRSLAPHITFEVQSVQAMKILAVDGIAACVLPFGIVRPELLSGHLVGLRVTGARLERTLYLVRPEQHVALHNEAALLSVIDTTKYRLMDLLGPLGHLIGDPS